jgi:5-hydroxyisourate hydrolase
MSKITTHILDTSKGCPAAGVTVELYVLRGDVAEEIGIGITNADGRIADWAAADMGKGVGDGSVEKGVYKIRFETKEYFGTIPTFYPLVEICFELTMDGHYHIPLLISPFGYSTYRGS